MALLMALTVVLVRRELKRSTAPMDTLPPQRTGLAHVLFEKRWRPFVAGVIIGLIASAAYPLSFASGRKSALGITTASANLSSYLVTGNTERVDWGVMLVLGIGAKIFLPVGRKSAPSRRPVAVAIPA
nr:YeeE/YedE thiosulfate transporter family protein [Luteococcus japonicus]